MLAVSVRGVVILFGYVVMVPVMRARATISNAQNRWDPSDFACPPPKLAEAAPNAENVFRTKMTPCRHIECKEILEMEG